MRGSRLRLALVGIISVAVLGLSACGIKPATEERGVDTIVIDTANYPSTLDPGLQYDTDTYSVYRNIFDQLLRRDPETNEVVPWLATKWKQETATRWRFTMRDDVTFSNGDPLTAEDAAYSINRIIDKDFGSQQYANFSAIDKASADGKDLIIDTVDPSPTLLSYLTTLSVVPKDYVEEVGNEKFALKPIGSGAFTVTATTSGSEITLKSNPDWWGPETDIKTAVFRSVPNVASRVSDLQSRRADLVTGLTPDAADQVQRDKNLKILSTPTERIAYLGFNTIHGGATNDPLVRQAIRKAINYDALIKNLQRGYAKAANSMVTPLAFGHDDELPVNTYDPDGAKDLLKQADQEGATLEMATSPSFDPQIVQAVQADLAKIGLHVKITNSDQATYLKKVQGPERKWGSIRFGKWSCSCLDSDGVIYPLFHTGEVWSSYSNPTFDKAVEKARATTDVAERKRYYRQAYGILDQDLPGIGLFQVNAIYGANSRLDWAPDASESLFLDRMKVSDS